MTTVGHEDLDGACNDDLKQLGFFSSHALTLL